MGVVAFVAFVAVMLVLAFWPIPHPFSMTLGSSPSIPGSRSVQFPVGANVAGRWSTSNGTQALFEIIDSSGNLIYVHAGSAGSFSFRVTSPPYEFLCSTPYGNASTDVSGNYAIPFL